MNVEIGTEAAQFPEKVNINEILVATQAVSGSIQTRYQKDVLFFRWIGEKYTQTQPTPVVLLMMTVYWCVLQLLYKRSLIDSIWVSVFDKCCVLGKQIFLYTVKKSLRFSSPQSWCQLPNSSWPGRIKLFPARESLVSDIPAGEKKIAYLFLQCKVVYAYFYVFSLYRTDCEEYD